MRIGKNDYEYRCEKHMEGDCYDLLLGATITFFWGEGKAMRKVIPKLNKTC
jgi:hypothetical protein